MDSAKLTLLAEVFLDVRSLLLFGIVFLFVFWWILQWTYEQRRLPPGPFSWPLIGTFPTFAWNSYKSRVGLHDLLTYFSHKYGNIYNLNNFGSYMIVISDSQVLKEALNNPHINARLANNLSGKVLGINLNAYEDFHPYRRFAMKTFRQFGVGKQSFEGKVADESEILRKEIIKLAGKNFDLHLLINNATANVICSVVYGHRYDYNDAEFQHLMQLANRWNHALGAAGVFNNLPILSSLPTKTKRNMEAVAQPLQKFIAGIVEEHRKTFETDKTRDFVDAYLCEQEQYSDSISGDQSYVTDDNIRGHLTLLFIAGADTTSIVIYWAILFLLVNPDIQKKVQSELDSVVGRNRFPRISDKINLPYTRAVIQEVYRVASPVPLSVVHGVSDDTKVGPYFVPKGATVVPNIWAIHHDPQLWKDPDEFKPERFIGAGVRDVIPFSVGRRSCPGEAFAQTMVFIFFTHLLHQFTFVIPVGISKPSFVGELGLLYKPQNYLACALERDFD